MKCNIGKTERLIRVAGGLLLMGAGIFIGGLWALLGAVVMATALVGWCPVSAVLGLSSCRDNETLPSDTSGQHTDRKPQDRLLK
jgi:hypothetical protein